jgi:hypothetical protein
MAKIYSEIRAELSRGKYSDTFWDLNQGDLIQTQVKVSRALSSELSTLCRESGISRSDVLNRAFTREIVRLKKEIPAFEAERKRRTVQAIREAMK